MSASLPKADVTLTGSAHAPQPGATVALVSVAFGHPGNRFERTLAKTVKDLPMDTEVGWRRMERRLEAEPPRHANLGGSGATAVVTILGVA